MKTIYTYDRKWVTYDSKEEAENHQEKMVASGWSIFEPLYFDGVWEAWSIEYEKHKYLF